MEEPENELRPQAGLQNWTRWRKCPHFTSAVEGASGAVGARSAQLNV